MQEPHILNMLRAQKRKHISFHTPGHKRAGLDITELSYSDNLSDPKGVLLRAERDISQIVGSEASFLLTDGSTSGVFSMMYALKKRGAAAIACPEFSHPCVFHAASVLGIKLVLLRQKISFGLFQRIEEEELLRGLKIADALLLTSPDYYGFLPPLKEARKLCDAEHKPLLIDGAHGSHLHFTDLYAGKYADLWVDGAHKSLPACTQGALVSAKSEEWVAFLREGVHIFRTTSPSYPIMASVEYAYKFPRNEELEQLSETFKLQHGCVKNDDWTKILIPFGSEGERAERILEEKGIFPEFFDGNYLMFYLSPCTKRRELALLGKEISKLPRGTVREDAVCGHIPMYGSEAQ